MEEDAIDLGLQAIDEADKGVFKFGGDDARKFYRNLEFARELIAAGKKVVFVFSAIRSSEERFGAMSLVPGKKGFNTTDHLIAMAKAVSVFDKDGKSNFDEAMKYLNVTRDFTRVILEENFEEGELRDKMISCMESEFANLEAKVREACGLKGAKWDRFEKQGDDYMYFPDDGSIFSFTGFGEELAEKLNVLFFKERGLNVEALNSSEESVKILSSDPKSKLEKTPNIVDEARDEIADKVMSLVDKHDVVVSGGRIPGAAESRGYSDVAGKILEEILRARGDVQKVVYGVAKESPIMSGDPRTMEGTRLVPRMNLELADETFGVSGAEAGALHTDAAKRIDGEDEKIVIFVPGDRKKGSTLITKKYTPEVEQADLVQKKKIPLTVEISSPDMVDRNGVVGFIAGKFSKYSIGHLFTNEGTMLLTFNENIDDNELAVLEDELGERFDSTYKVTPRRDASMVFILANKMNSLLEVYKATAALINIKVRPIRLEGGDNLIKFLVNDEDADKVAQALHKAVIVNKPQQVINQNVPQQATDIAA